MATTLPTFPASSFDVQAQMLAVVGGFWSEMYHGRDLVGDILFARGRVEVQTDQSFQTLLSCPNLAKIPPFVTNNWGVFTILASQLNQFAADLPEFDEGYLFDAGLSFDTPLPGALSVWQAPPNLASVNVISNGITFNDVVWTQGVDFYVNRGALWLRENPFNNPAFTIRNIFTNNVVTDQACDLWLYRAQYDQRTLDQQYGYVFGLAQPSSQRYKELLLALHGSLVHGTTNQAIQTALAALCDVSLARTAETVVQTFVDTQYLRVVTDQNVYRFNPNSTLLVKVGDTVQPGDPFVDTLRIYDCNQGQIPADIPELSISPGLLAQGYSGPLIFGNETVPLIVDTSDPSGYTKVSFALGGAAADVTAFWNNVQAAGVAANQTLAMLMDQRPKPVNGQPTALALPSIVNPLGFLIQNVFRDNLYLVKIVTAQLGSNALPLDPADILRQLNPPNVTGLVVYV
jgi:hypothetical protein